MQFVLLRRSEPGVGLQFVFDTDTCQEVLLGRDPGCHVALDPETDRIAGLFHARILPDPKSPSGLIVIDMSSRNGTFVDGVPVRGQAALKTNSSLLLGRLDSQLGPEFQVNIGESPWQPAVPPYTRELEAPPPDQFRPNAAPPPPSPYPAGVPYQAAPPPPSPYPAGVPYQAAPPPPSPYLAGVPHQAAPGGAGSEKWWDEQLPGVPSMRGPDSARASGLPRNVNVRESKFRWTRAVVGVISVVSVLLALWWIRQSQAPSVWTAQEIEQTYGNSILATELTWRLVDSPSGTQLYQWRPRLPFKPNDRRLSIFQGRDRASAFIRMPDGVIEPVLILGAGVGGNEPVGGHANGSAVAVHSGGFVLTDRRNATPWTLSYEWPQNSFPGILIDPQTKQVDVIDRLNQSWMPLRARAVMAGEPTVDELTLGALSPAAVTLEGHIEVYQARGRNSTIWLQANSAATSEGSQLAVAKVQTDRPPAEIRVPEADPPLLLGQRVFVLGFVGSGQSIQLKATEFQILKAETSSTNGPDEFAILSGGLFDLGQTGSAVFDSKGRLAGLLRVIPRNGDSLGEIVPIRQGRELVRADPAR